MHCHGQAPGGSKNPRGCQGPLILCRGGGVVVSARGRQQKVGGCHLFARHPPNPLGFLHRLVSLVLFKWKEGVALERGKKRASKDAFQFQAVVLRPRGILVFQDGVTVALKEGEKLAPHIVLQSAVADKPHKAIGVQVTELRPGGVHHGEEEQDVREENQPGRAQHAGGQLAKVEDGGVGIAPGDGKEQLLGRGFCIACLSPTLWPSKVPSRSSPCSPCRSRSHDRAGDESGIGHHVRLD